MSNHDERKLFAAIFDVWQENYTEKDESNIESCIENNQDDIENMMYNGFIR